MGATERSSQDLRRLHVAGCQEGRHNGTGPHGKTHWLRLCRFYFRSGQGAGKDRGFDAKHQALEHAIRCELRGYIAPSFSAHTTPRRYLAEIFKVTHSLSHLVGGGGGVICKFYLALFAGLLQVLLLMIPPLHCCVLVCFFFDQGGLIYQRSICWVGRLYHYRADG